MIERCEPDLNRRITVLQTGALPLGYRTKYKTPRVGFEPTTLRLTAGCSTAELSRNKSDSDENRTRVTAVKGRCLNRLTTEPKKIEFSIENVDALTTFS